MRFARASPIACIKPSATAIRGGRVTGRAQSSPLLRTTFSFLETRLAVSVMGEAPPGLGECEVLLQDSGSDLTEADASPEVALAALTAAATVLIEANTAADPAAERHVRGKPNALSSALSAWRAVVVGLPHPVGLYQTERKRCSIAVGLRGCSIAECVCGCCKASPKRASRSAPNDTGLLLQTARLHALLSRLLSGLNPEPAELVRCSGLTGRERHSASGVFARAEPPQWMYDLGPCGLRNNIPGLLSTRRMRCVAGVNGLSISDSHAFWNRQESLSCSPMHSEWSPRANLQHVAHPATFRANKEISSPGH